MDDVTDEAMDVVDLTEEASVGVVVGWSADEGFGKVDYQVGGLERDWEGLVKCSGG